jgi:hypothetical protein
MAIHNFEALVREWQDLEAADIPLEPVENRVGFTTRSRGAGLTIRAGRDRWNSEIRELKNGSFAFILPVFIRRDLPGKTIIRDSWIAPPWPGAPVELLEDPKHEGRPPGYYTFPGDTDRFVRGKVLNHRMDCVLSRGDLRAGLVLAVGLAPPETFKNRQLVVVSFGVLDQWDVEHVAKLQIQINRLPKRAKAIKKSTRGRLLSRRDIIAPPRSLVVPRGPTDRNPKKDLEAIRRMEGMIARLQSKIDHAKVPVGRKHGTTRVGH